MCTAATPWAGLPKGTLQLVGQYSCVGTVHPLGALWKTVSSQCVVAKAKEHWNFSPATAFVSSTSFQIWAVTQMSAIGGTAYCETPMSRLLLAAVPVDQPP